MNLKTLLLASLLISADCFSQKIVNPVIDANVADPSVIRIGETYYAAATSGNAKQCYPLFKSTNLRDWQPMGHVFNQWPYWTDGAFWAPELFEWKGNVLCYYTAKQKSDGTSCIGVAFADGPEAPFRDCGPLIRTTNEAIDAYAVQVDGQLWITWKAYGLDPSGRPIEILAQRLSANGLRLEGEPISLLKDDERIGMEGQCIFKQGDYWYILYSIRDCCSPQSDYAVSVARSKQFTGPYEKYTGNPILEGNGKDIQSCGHGTMVTTPEGRMYYMCHAYFYDHYKEGRKAIIQSLQMDKNGWPTFNSKKSNKALTKLKVKVAR